MPLYHASIFLLTTTTVTIKLRMKQAKPPREMTPRERRKQRARERALKFAQEFFSDWLVEPHPTAAFVIKEAVSVLWPELRLDSLPIHPPLLESKKSFFRILRKVRASKLNHLVDLFTTMMLSRGTPLHGPAGSPTVLLRPVSQGQVEVSYTMPESELPALIAIQAADATSVFSPSEPRGFPGRSVCRAVVRLRVPDNLISFTILGHEKHKCTFQWHLLYYSISKVSSNN